MNVSVLQWNVWVHEKPVRILKALRDFDADIVCLQELGRLPPQLPRGDLQKRIASLGYYSSFAATIRRDDLHMGNAIFSKHPILRSKEVYLQQENMLSIPGHDENRIYLEAHISLPDGAIDVGTVHLSSSASFAPSNEKNLEAARLLDTIRHHRSRYILAGDLNYHCDDDFINHLTRHFKHCGPGFEEKTWPSRKVSYPSFNPELLSFRPDYIFATPDLTVQAARILRTPVSDHLPIIAEFSL